MKDSQLMMDSSDTNGKAEALLDYVLSWSLRNCDENSSNCGKPILMGYSKYMLATLLEMGKENINDIRFKTVKTWKQWNNIDLCVEVILEIAGQEEKLAILIEDKYYTNLHLSKDTDGKNRNQLVVYKKQFESCYNGKDGDWKLHYALISCLNSHDEASEFYGDIKKKYGFDLYSFYELLPEQKEYIDSESDIFNEFWLRKWQ